MKKIIAVFFSLMLYISSPAQQPFIKTIADGAYGFLVRILPTNDNGWVVFTTDSLKMTKFNNCGVPQWSKKYNIPNAEQALDNFIKTNDDGFVLLTRMQVPSQHPMNTNHVALLTKFDAQGNIQWSNSYEDPTDDYTQVPYTISEDPQGNLVVFCGVSYHVAGSTSYNLILKIDANGTLLSSRFYGFGGIWGGAIATSDNGVLIRTGSTFIKADNTGNVSWTSNFGSTQNHFAPIEVADGYIFTGQISTSSYTSFYKISKQGNLLLGGRKQTNLPGTPYLFNKKSNGNITAVFQNTVVEFDKDLNAVRQSSFTGGMGLYGKRICYLADGTPVQVGIKSPSSLFIAKMNTQYQTNCSTTPTVTTTIFNDVLQMNFTVGFFSYNIIEVSHVFHADTFSITMNVLCNPDKKLNIGGDTLLCFNNSILLQNTESDKFDFYQWSTGETTAVITVDKPGTYILKASYLTYGCLAESIFDTIVISYATRINNDLGTDVTACENESHLFSAPICDSCSFYWSTGSNNNTIVVNETGNYWLNITDSNGCIYSDTVNFVTSKCECQLYFPNSFTPNSDGLNESFQPYFYCDLFDYRLKIFNRWGQLVYSTQSAMESWDGKHQKALVPTGIYYFVASYTPFLKGKVDKPITRTGSVIVLY